jgi:hypothetical protein
MAVPTLLDIVKMNNSDKVVGLIDESMRAVPEVRIGAARTIRGISFKTLVRAALGTTSAAFRAANAGSTPIAHRYENRNIECFILEAPWRADKAIADSYEDGARAYVAMEAAGVLEGQFQGLGKQFFYGTNTTYGGAANGNPGLIDAYDATNKVVDAGGTTATTGSSVWLLEFGARSVQWVWGNATGLNIVPDLDVALANPVTIVDSADSTKQYLGYQQTIFGRPGLQVASPDCVVRIKKLTADSGKGLTDTLIAQALAKFPAGRQPNAVFMSRRSLSQLRASRTATTPKGDPAPFPREIAGIAGENIPIYITDSLSDVEALTL